MGNCLNRHRVGACAANSAKRRSPAAKERGGCSDSGDQSKTKKEKKNEVVLEREEKFLPDDQIAAADFQSLGHEFEDFESEYSDGQWYPTLAGIPESREWTSTDQIITHDEHLPTASL
ncbi:hypothetical protein KSP40_PGU011436 [Platanthera guangdongensis]|uniref:Uncharacterized protein n=1 Tax=Platanthera guangdongensis TaxID=2320717 RepID=A0ABR2N1D9_9ASPA